MPPSDLLHKSCSHTVFPVVFFFIIVLNRTTFNKSATSEECAQGSDCSPSPQLPLPLPPIFLHSNEHCLSNLQKDNLNFKYCLWGPDHLVPTDISVTLHSFFSHLICSRLLSCSIRISKNRKKSFLTYN